MNLWVSLHNDFMIKKIRSMVKVRAHIRRAHTKKGRKRIVIRGYRKVVKKNFRSFSPELETKIRKRKEVILMGSDTLLPDQAREIAIRELKREKAIPKNLGSAMVKGFSPFKETNFNEDVTEARRLGMRMKSPEAALRAVRLTFDKPEDLECVGASCALLDPIRKFYPDAELARLSVKRPGTDATDSHTIIISDRSNKIIDSQAGQFKGRLKLSDSFINKGIYNIDEYSKNIPFTYSEKVSDNNRINLFKILKTKNG